MNRSFEANFVKSDLRYKIFEKLKELDIQIPFSSASSYTQE